MIESDIATLLMSTLAAQTYQDDTGANMEYVWPEINFTPTSPKYINVSYLGNQPGWEGLVDNIERLGILQVNVVWPKMEGEIKPLTVASQIAAAWKKGTTLFVPGLKVKVYRGVWVSGPISDQIRVMCPVNIPWAAYTTT